MVPTSAPHTPPGTGKVGMLFFLAALAMLFLAGMVAYALIRTGGADAPPPGSIHVPPLLWVSTVIILTSSVTIQHAVICVQWEQQRHFRISMLATLGLAVLFIAVQSPSLIELIDRHREMVQGSAAAAAAAATGRSMYGLVFVLLVLHGLHVLGGLVPLSAVTLKSLLGRYDHEQHRAVSYVAMYWHFLGGVWLVMFVVLLVLS